MASIANTTEGDEVIGMVKPSLLAVFRRNVFYCAVLYFDLSPLKKEARLIRPYLLVEFGEVVS